MKHLYPLLFYPIYKPRVWGGDRIRTNFNRNEIPEGIGESWELSDREDSMSIIENGPLRGLTLRKVFTTYHQELMGEDDQHTHFPLLLKLIDAQHNLSIQVHPPSGPKAKNEAWFIIKSDQNSTVYAGFKEIYSKKYINQSLPHDTIIDLMRTLPVKANDMISIPGGRLHAIGAGNLLFEVQQSSDTTYRVYDWGRKRDLHLDAAKSVIKYDDIDLPHIEPQVIHSSKDYEQILLIKTPYFVIEKWHLHQSIEWSCLNNQCEMLFCLDGNNSLVPPGRTCLIPASQQTVHIKTSGTTLLRIFLPKTM